MSLFEFDFTKKPLKIDLILKQIMAVVLVIALTFMFSIYVGFSAGVLIVSILAGALSFYALNLASNFILNVNEKTLVEHSELKLEDDKLFENLPVSMIVVDAEGTISKINSSASQLIGHDNLEGAPLSSLIEGMGRSIPDRLSDTLKGFGIGKPEMAHCKKDGYEIYLQVAMSKMPVGSVPFVLIVLSDATELKSLEAQFVQSQKMQAVGQLAGGIAHDFNNILTAIMGHADLLLHKSDATAPEYSDLVQIKENSNRAAGLIKQLLAFSRKQTLLPKSINLEDTLSDLSHLLNRLLGEKVTLHVEHGATLKPVRVDVRQFEQVIMNLVVNARDAMPDGGAVTIKTFNLKLEQELRRDRAVVHPGEYVIVEVSDTGVGISRDKINKIFEPFFTTKKIGEGTGLGLATVYGIIKQTGGFVFVDSQQGKGSVFSIYLPIGEIIEPINNEMPSISKPLNRPTSSGAVLLVEDEAPVRAFAARALTLRGFSVTEAASGEEALSILQGDSNFDVFVSDVVMPGKNGPTWVAEALKSCPETKVVFVSGYAEDAFEDGKIPIPNSSFLAKPFSLGDLVQAVCAKVEK